MILAISNKGLFVFLHVKTSMYHSYMYVLYYSMSQPHFEANVRMKLTLPKDRTWSPPRLSKTQSLIARVKTPCIEVFFIPLEKGLEM
jgi:hypothetical protein